MKALIDADIFQYEFGSATDSEYKLLSWPLVQSRVQARIDSIMEAIKHFGVDSYQLYLTSDDKSNFRYKIATIRPYKGNRPTEKPYWYQAIRNFLIDHRGAQEVTGMEADDAISIEAWRQKDWCENVAHIDYDCYGPVICSRDKDLDMIPGWHYCWGAGKQKEKPVWWQDELGGLKSFYKQLLTGDTVDNIPGLYGVGKSSSLLSNIEHCTSDLDMYEYVFSEYTKRFGTYASLFLTENARLLWLLRSENEEWVPPT